MLECVILRRAMKHRDSKNFQRRPSPFEGRVTTISDSFDAVGLVVDKEPRGSNGATRGKEKCGGGGC
jgi:hypothetical protein